MNCTDVQLGSDIHEAAIAAFLARSWVYLTRTELPPPPRSSAAPRTPKSWELPASSTSRARARRRARLRALHWDLQSAA